MVDVWKFPEARADISGGRRKLPMAAAVQAASVVGFFLEGVRYLGSGRGILCFQKSKKAAIKETVRYPPWQSGPPLQIVPLPLPLTASNEPACPSKAVSALGIFPFLTFPFLVFKIYTLRSTVNYLCSLVVCMLMQLCSKIKSHFND